MIAYTVACNFNEPLVAEEWIAWLREEHLAQVIAAGALDAEVILVEHTAGSSGRCEVRYHFADRKSFALYERDHATRLRAEGLKRFPPERGLSYERSLGEVRIRHPQAMTPDLAN